jgi:hypothetical protein
MTRESPEDLKTLSVDQRDKLLEFIWSAKQIIGDGDFERDALWKDCELMAFSLRLAQILGYTDGRLEALFQREFGISGVTENELADWLAVLLSADPERRIRCAAGGRN